jgi:6-pyruvoyltetrahydropterin/6-carboxytetrahydropterin synthase
MPKFRSTKTYGPERGYAVAYRQHRAESHCNQIHGYALGFHFVFESEEVDVRNWVVDFGSLKTLKSKLDDWFDHTMLVAQDDPDLGCFQQIERWGLAKLHIVERTGCEGLAKSLYEYINDVWMEENGYAGRVRCVEVQVRETPANMASYGDY